MPRYRMLIDADKCMNCKACVLGCQQRNEVPYGFSRNWIRKDVSLEHKYGWAFQPGGCMQCASPLCVEACPTKATWKDQDGVVVVDFKRCIGCGGCIEACPYDARHRDPVHGIADKCDYCASTRPLGLEPACVQLCPTRARIFGDDTDPASEVSKVLATHKIVTVESVKTPTAPTLAYIDKTVNTAWPRPVTVPTPLALMGPVATGIRWIGGFALLGILGVFVKQLLLPSDEEPHGDAKQKAAENSTAQKASGKSAAQGAQAEKKTTGQGGAA